jgi:hypothetical protein
MPPLSFGESGAPLKVKVPQGLMGVPHADSINAVATNTISTRFIFHLPMFRTRPYIPALDSLTRLKFDRESYQNLTSAEIVRHKIESLQRE